MAATKAALSAADTEDDDDEDLQEAAEAIDATDDLAEAEEFTPGDLLGKVLAFVNQVRSSPQARAFFLKVCKDEGLPELQLLKWVRTRWASLYDLITRLLKVRRACNKFTLLADDDERVPNLKPPKTYSVFKLTDGEWQLLELIRDALQEPAAACQTFSHSSRPTVYRAFPVIEFMQTKWEQMAANPKYAIISQALNAGLDNLRKWYRTLDNSNMYFISLVLDPRIKMAYFRRQWEQEYLEVGMRNLEEVVCHRPYTIRLTYYCSLTDTTRLLWAQHAPRSSLYIPRPPKPAPTLCMVLPGCSRQFQAASLKTTSSLIPVANSATTSAILSPFLRIWPKPRSHNGGRNML